MLPKRHHVEGDVAIAGRPRDANPFLHKEGDLVPIGGKERLFGVLGSRHYTGEVGIEIAPVNVIAAFAAGHVSDLIAFRRDGYRAGINALRHGDGVADDAALYGDWVRAIRPGNR